MDYRSSWQALDEAREDLEQGADILIVKPALAYLDVISRLKDNLNAPIAAYNVSAEYSMVKACSQNGWVDEKDIVLEKIYGIKRAGATIINHLLRKRSCQMDSRGNIKMKIVWLIGGTKDSRELASRIAKNMNKLIISTSSKYGKKLVEGIGAEVVDKKMDKNEMEKFVLTRGVNVIVDASHPYAQNVSKNAMEVAREHGLKYLRFEREMISYEGAHRFDDLDAIVTYLNSNYFDGNILSTLGVNSLHKLKNLEMLDKLYVRILPVKASIEIAENLGYPANHIIALQGPFSKQFNKDMMRNVQHKVYGNEGKWQRRGRA